MFFCTHIQISIYSYQSIDLCVCVSSISFETMKKKNTQKKLGALLPSHGLPPFGANITNIAMSEGLCGSSMFGSDRWSVGVTPMTAGK